MTIGGTLAAGPAPARYRFAALAGALGGLGWAFVGVATALIDVGAAAPNYRALDALSIPALALMLVGLVAFRGLDRGTSGSLGAVGFLLVLLGLAAALVGAVLSTVTSLPIAWDLFTFGYPATLIGAGVYGAARLRAGIEPRLGAVLSLAALPAGLAGSLLLVLVIPTAGDDLLAAGPAVLLGAAWIVLGLHSRDSPRTTST